MVFSSCDVGPAGRMHPGTEQAPNSRHPRREFARRLKEVVVREGIPVREISKGRDQQRKRASQLEANNVEFAYVPFYASWLNRIEAQFTAPVKRANVA